MSNLNKTAYTYSLDQLCPTRGPVNVFPAVKVSYILTTCPYFDNLGICHFWCRCSSVPLHHAYYHCS